MALNWKIDKVKDWKEVTEGAEWQATDALIWATMGVGLWHITEKNYREFYTRLHLQELLWGTYLLKDGGPRYITLEEVKRRIGLTTNASEFSRAEFNKRKLKHYYEDTLEEVK